ncbi:ATP-binding cassette domain-containing protein [Alteromonas sp. 5E99-2]|uniref:ATP-binding cassette ATPase Uup n=1 Tax=Alteromonas sp. 5E99-2 TaxID=2817683 RepID=UPI001A98DAD4|nr:ATP-binding cassette domain-containing protein [Alteromonas sp. 5E99-2]MBO1255025.1 ATP-binding cassette domain-containing protein [Alteromonas sp. 5E99-2]
MSNLIQLKNIHLSFGTPPLLDSVNLNIHEGERVCLVGRNGSGKSTLMKLIAGDIQADDGQRILDSSCVVARLEQDPPERNDISIFDYVAEGLKEAGELLKAYQAKLNDVTEDPSEKNLAGLQVIQDKLDSVNGWQIEQRISQTLTTLSLDGDALLSSLSGGWRRKAALARAWVQSPDLLLLDEPTNHLDIAMIKWLEDSLKQFSGAIVFISHDRAFIRSMSTRIIDLDRGVLTSYPGNYETYLIKKAEDQAILETQQAEFDKKLAQEEVWIRQGIKARRTRNEGRVRALEALRAERKKRRELQGSVMASQSTGARSGKRVFDVVDVAINRGEKVIAQSLNLNVMRKDRIALIGPNGCGKSTLIQGLLGDLPLTSGEIKHGANIEVAYFDQHRSQLDLDKTVIDTVGDGKRDLMVNGNPRHVISYLQDYLFEPDRVNAPVRSLSGGEKNRLLLAKIMLKPSNVLILDEPTNDLDVDTLEMLETLLIGYEGTILLVSHDREFVDNVASSCLTYENNGIWREFVGGYTDMLNWYEHNKNADKVQGTETKDSSLKTSVVKPKAQKKLSYKDSRELETLPIKIDELESQIEELQSQVNEPDFFNKTDSNLVLEALSKAEKALGEAYSRWDELESMQQSIQQ